MRFISYSRQIVFWQFLISLPLITTGLVDYWLSLVSSNVQSTNRICGFVISFRSLVTLTIEINGPIQQKKSNSIFFSVEFLLVTVTILIVLYKN